MEEPVSFNLEKSQKEKIEKIADSEHRSLAGQLRLVVDEWLSEYAKSK